MLPHQIAHARAAGNVHERAIVSLARAVLRTVPDAFLFVADPEDVTASELLECYAPAELRLASITSDAFIVCALSRPVGMRLLATPEHRQEGPSTLCDIARAVRDHPGRAFVLIVAGGGVLAQSVRLCDDGAVALGAAASEGGLPS